MPVNFPNSLCSPRAVVNKDGIVYNPSSLDHMFSEDFLGLADEIIAIQKQVGNPLLGNVLHITPIDFSAVPFPVLSSGSPSLAISPGCNEISTGAVNGNYVYKHDLGSSTGNQLLDDTKDWLWEIYLQLFGVVTQDIKIGTAYNSDTSGAYFQVDNGVLTAVVNFYNGDEELSSFSLDVSAGVDLTLPHLYKIINTAGDCVRFYIDGVLVATATGFDLADSNVGFFSQNYFNVYIKTLATGAKILLFRYFHFAQNL